MFARIKMGWLILLKKTIDAASSDSSDSNSSSGSAAEAAAGAAAIIFGGKKKNDDGTPSPTVVPVAPVSPTLDPSEATPAQIEAMVAEINAGTKTAAEVAAEYGVFRASC